MRTPSHKDSNQSKIQINRNPPALDKDAWEEINTEFAKVNEDSWNKFRTKETEPEKYIETLNKSLAEYLKSKPEFQHEAKEFFKHKKPNSDPIEEMKEKK